MPMSDLSKRLSNAQKDFQLSKTHYTNLYNRLNNLMAKYEPDNPDDARHAGWQGLLMVTMLAMNTFKNFAPVHAGDDSLYDYCWYVETSEEQRDMLVDTLEVMHRGTYMTLFMFQVEIFIKSIAVQLNINLQTTGKYPKQKGYRALTREIIDVLFSEGQQQRIDYLNILAMVRNCLHSSGYHKEIDKKISIGKYDFEFKKGEKINFTSWQHIHLFSNTLITILEEILNSKRLINVPKIGKYNFV